MYQFKVHRIGDVCTLQAWVLVCNTLLHMLLYQFDYKEIESLTYRKKTLKLAYQGTF